MLQINTEKRALPVNNSTDFSLNTNQYDHNVYRQLAELSNKRQWILFTANCPRPSHTELTSFDINCSNVIHMKPSLHLSEAEIVIKAIQAGTASAVVASSTLSHYEKAKVLSVAGDYHCNVFFLTESQQSASHLWH
ncbi:hypothetical protein [Vibrio sp. SCSIO 43137]|uniref:hypothetical protein n=1 Tax=Vibrio sp. SCSIO 43137 TaxID=3021011 RepID=UPI002306FACD|nr:hypothetical protein [Vibrio sp. SCSIO 43137]WCE30973.1 hypothetical protein PK654_06825 [Vibrio sp. SCSIO 43137]